MQVIPPAIIQSLWDAIWATRNATNITRVSNAVEKVILDGYPVSVLISLLEKHILSIDSSWFYDY